MNQIVNVGRLQKAIDKIKDLGLSLSMPEAQPIADLVAKISDADPTKSLTIARTVTAMQGFDTLVADHLSSTNYGDRFNAINEGFNSIIDDAKRQVSQEQKGGPSVPDRVGNIVMKLVRGDIADRFAKIEEVYNSVIQDAGKTIAVQAAILDAYADARLALKDGEIAALDIFDIVTKQHQDAKKVVDDANASVSALGEGGDRSERAKLELARDEAMNGLRQQEERYQIAKNLSEMLTVSYSVSEATFGKYHQAHEVLNGLYQKTVLFFNIQRPVLTAMKATYTGLMAVAELAKTQKAMEDGINRSLEALASISETTLKEGLKVTYGSGIRVESVKMLVDSVVSFQSESSKIIEESRKSATEDVNAIRMTVENGKRAMADLVAKAA